jgi:hypothetical protein
MRTYYLALRPALAFPQEIGPFIHFLHCLEKQLQLEVVEVEAEIIKTFRSLGRNANQHL